MKKNKKTIAISGGFDPLHPGHITMIEEAQKYGEVHIVLNSDDWLVRKKGFFFQPWEDRRKILEAYTPNVHAVDDSDEHASVCEALSRIKPDYFGNGGDRKKDNIPEYDLCEKLDIQMVFGLGGGKYSSSSEINGKNRVKTSWGWYDVIINMPKLKVKLLHVTAGKNLSMEQQQLQRRFFFMPTGEVRVNLSEVEYVLEAPADKDLDVLEVQVGMSEKEDKESVLETDGKFAKKKKTN